MESKYSFRSAERGLADVGRDKAREYERRDRDRDRDRGDRRRRSRSRGERRRRSRSRSRSRDRHRKVLSEHHRDRNLAALWNIIQIPQCC